MTDTPHNVHHYRVAGSRAAFLHTFSMAASCAYITTSPWIQVYPVPWDSYGCIESRRRRRRRNEFRQDHGPHRELSPMVLCLCTSLNCQGKRCVVFYGSQSGTSESYAVKIAREARARYGLGSLVCDLENYDLEHLDTLPIDSFAIFIMSVYGEGEPTDNARAFMDFINDTTSRFSLGGNSLGNLNYVIFGLGNSTYAHYNRVSRILDARLRALGAHRIGERGEGDDDGSIEEDFLAWQDGVWQEVAKTLELEEGSSSQITDYTVREVDDSEGFVYRGELSAWPPH
jgi:sulfite reductase alpha subunit-like flavoprotein